MKKYIDKGDFIAVIIGLFIGGFLIYLQDRIGNQELIIILLLILICYISYSITGGYLEFNFYNRKQFKYLIDSGFQKFKNDKKASLVGINNDYVVKIEFSKNTRVNNSKQGWAYIVEIYFGEILLSKEQVLGLNKKYKKRLWTLLNSTDYSELVWLNDRL